jgi:8-amino-7-oxononanoate synthase
VTAAALDARLGGELARIRAAGRHRAPRSVSGRHGVDIEVDGRRCLNFCSNDYLDLAADPRLAEAAVAALRRGGTGSGAAALVSGYDAEHRALEEELAAFLGRPRVLLFSSGWAANLGTLRALFSRADAVAADELNHASLIDGLRLCGAQYLRCRHASAAAVDAALADVDARERGIVSDAVFSMDGDVAPLAALAVVARRRRATLMLDDAHGFGVYGPGGRGSVAAAGLGLEDVPVYVATLGKALGVAGAFVAGSETLIDYLIQRARTWVFSTAAPPALAAAARRALQIVQQEPERVARLHRNVASFRRLAAQAHVPLSDSLAPIQPLIVGSEGAALALSHHLRERGFWVAAIRPPTVPAGTSRLRLTLSAGHEPAQIEALVDALAEGFRLHQAA